MTFSCRERWLTAAMALTASGVLTCGWACAGALLPHDSVLATLISVPLRGAVVSGALIGFAWTCQWLDRSDRRFDAKGILESQPILVARTSDVCPGSTQRPVLQRTRAAGART